MLNALRLKRGRGLATITGALGGGSILFAAIMLVNILNYGYALLLGRFLGPESYGSYASFISLFLLVSLLPLTLQQVTAKYAAADKSVLKDALKVSLSVGGVLGLGLALSAVWLAPLINLPTAWLVGLGLALPVYALVGALRGEVQGQQKLSYLGGNMVLEHVAKIALTPLVFLGLANASGAVLATLGALPMVVLNLKSVWYKQLKHVERPELSSQARRYAVPVFLGLAAQALLINSDVLMANALLSEVEAGLYAATSLVGRVVFYASWAVSVVLFPMVAARGAKGEGHVQLLYLGLGATSLMCLGAVAFCALWPELVVTLLFGQAYLAAAALVAPYAFMTSLYALANILSNHYLALGRSAAGYIPLGAALIQLLLMGLYANPLELIWIQALVKGGLLLVLLGAACGFLRQGDKHVLR